MQPADMQTDLQQLMRTTSMLQPLLQTPTMNPVSVAVASAGVTATPVITSWRLSGEEAFVVLGSPGLWAAMNPAEVVDYIAAALASGACSSSMQPGGNDDAAADRNDSSLAAHDTASTPAQQLDQSDAAAAAEAAVLRPDAAVLLSDLLTLEAQERLKLRLSDISTLIGLGGAAAAAMAGGGGGGHQVVPDVTAVVLLLSGPLPQQKGVQDRVLLQQELACVTRYVGYREGVSFTCVSRGSACVLHSSVCQLASVRVGLLENDVSTNWRGVPASKRARDQGTCSPG
jgi:hypothetical protein